MIKGKLALVTCALTWYSLRRFRRVVTRQTVVPEGPLALSQRKALILCWAGATAATYCFMRRYAYKRRHELG